jgi:hypothetical protein
MQDSDSGKESTGAATTLEGDDRKDFARFSHSAGKVSVLGAFDPPVVTDVGGGAGGGTFGCFFFFFFFFFFSPLSVFLLPEEPSGFEGNAGELSSDT